MHEETSVTPFASETTETTSRHAFSTYELLIDNQEEYKRTIIESVRRTIMELQADDRLPSAPMSDADRNNLVLAFIQALDRGLCPNEEDAKREWILGAASAIYRSADSSHSSL